MQRVLLFILKVEIIKEYLVHMMDWSEQNLCPGYSNAYRVKPVDKFSAFVF